MLLVDAAKCDTLAFNSEISPAMKRRLMLPTTELQACTPLPLTPDGFNPDAQLPYGLTVQHLHNGMGEFLDFIGFVNLQLNSRAIRRLESMLMPANFSSIVGEFMAESLPHYCPSLTKNTFHNGHPDLVPTGLYPDNAVQHAHEGIEIKASRYRRGWQGHNPEEIWLMVFVFDSNRPKDQMPRPFQFLTVAGALLTEDDWRFAGRSATSRRTITASVTESGYQKMMTNWLYRS